MGFEEGLKLINEKLTPDTPPPPPTVGWVEVAQLLAVPIPPNPDESADIRDVQEIHAYFSDAHPDSPMFAFTEHLSKLPVIPFGESRLAQVLRSVRFKRLASFHRRLAERYESA